MQWRLDIKEGTVHGDGLTTPEVNKELVKVILNSGTRCEPIVACRLRPQA